MAERPRHDSLTCSVCLEILKDPVTLPCGHSYCRECIETVWSKEVGYSCPECRQSFSPRPVLCKNTALANLLEEMKTAELKMARADSRKRKIAGLMKFTALLGSDNSRKCKTTGVQKVLDDLCCGNSGKQKKMAPMASLCYDRVTCTHCSGEAVNSCLECLYSFCKNHIQPHREDSTLQQHRLVEPRHKLLDHHCFPHNELKTLFCTTDKELICHDCVGQHKGHDIVPSAAERAERQKHVDTKKTQQLQTLLDKETEHDQLRQEALDIRTSAQAAVDRSRNSFREMALLLEEKRCYMEQQIKSEEQSQLKRVQDLQDQLQEDISTLKKNISGLDTLSLTPDHSQFILTCPSLSTLEEEPETRNQTGDQAEDEAPPKPRKDFEDFIKPVSLLEGRLKQNLFGFSLNVWKIKQSPKIDFRIGPNFPKVFPPEPLSDSRADFLKYACDVTLNPKTANRLLALSDGNRKASLGINSSSDDPDRFIDCYQVLSAEPMTGRHYWEVELSGKYFIDVAVSYRDIERGRRPDCQSVFGHNDKSWALCCDTNGYTFRFNRQPLKIAGPVSSRIGVYLNHKAGILSFYSVSDETVSIIHKVQTKFSQPLFAGVGFALVGDAAHFLPLK